jgi:hypothetical protein
VSTVVELVRTHAREKARSVAHDADDRPVLGVDTDVVLTSPAHSTGTGARELDDESVLELEVFGDMSVGQGCCYSRDLRCHEIGRAQPTRFLLGDPEEAVVFVVKHDLSMRGRFGSKDGRRACDTFERHALKVEAGFFPQFASGSVMRFLAPLNRPCGRRPRPFALEITAACVPPVQDQELARPMTVSPHDDASSTYALSAVTVSHASSVTRA